MNFSSFTKVTSGNVIYFRNETPIENVGSIKFYKDNATGSFLKKEFRWSFDRNHWSSWEDLNIGNVAKISTGINKYFFIEVKYTMSSATSGKVSSFFIEYLPSSGQTYAPSDNINLENSHTLSDGCNDLGGTVKKYEVIEVTNANTLCGKDCEYYLWRPNHKGTQPISSITNLQNILNTLSAAVREVDIKGALNVDGPGIGVYYLTENKQLYFKTIVEGNKVFVTQDSNGHITISMDDASINQLFTEIGTLSGVNVGGGAGEVFKERLDGNLQFRTIVGGNENVIVTTVGDQIRISLDASTTGEYIWTDPDPVSADVGGIKGSGNGGNYAPVGENTITILENILYEYFPPNITLNINPPSNYYEKWVSSTDVSVFGSFENSSFVKVRVTDVSAYNSLIGGFGHISYLEVSSGTFAFNSPGSAYWDDTVYTIKIYNKVGLTTMPPAEASTSIHFVNPYTWGIVPDTINAGNITAGTIQGFISSGNKLVVPKQDNEINFIRSSSDGMKIKFVYAYDASYGDLDSIFDIRNNFNVTDSFDKTTINVTLGASPTPIPYRVYIKSHWIDVSSFKLIFNI